MSNNRASADPTSPDDVIEAVHAVMHAVRARQQRALRDAGHGQTPLEGRVLSHFARNPGSTLSELAAHSGRDKGQLARLIGSLRERGLLEASADENDRRSLRLRLTAEGVSIHQALQRERRRLGAAAVAGLDMGERRALVALLTKLRSGVERAP